MKIFGIFIFSFLLISASCSAEKNPDKNQKYNLDCAQLKIISLDIIKNRRNGVNNYEKIRDIYEKSGKLVEIKLEKGRYYLMCGGENISIGKLKQEELMIVLGE
jgi:hypothetical protein